MTNPPDIVPSGTETALSAAEVENVLAQMSKALRAFNMYQANNPVFQRFQDGLRDAIRAVWAKVDRLELTVQEGGFKWGDEVFSVGKGRDSLAFAFYKDGVRFITLLPGFEDEVVSFLDSVNRAMRSGEDADDLISALWLQDDAYAQLAVLFQRRLPADLLGPLLQLDEDRDLGAQDHGVDGLEHEVDRASGVGSRDMGCLLVHGRQEDDRHVA